MNATRERTHDCGALRKSDAGARVVLNGWVHRRRDHGGVMFVDLRDRYGLTQVVFRPEAAPGAHKSAERIRGEFVLSVGGTVALRPAGMVNADLPTGDIEVVADDLEILSEATPLPFPIEGEADVSETLRLKYRYLDLRRPELQKNLVLRHSVTRAIRGYLDGRGFVEVETPVLTRSTPEGARDYLVPSRLHPGKFYALPQSPQLFKQLLMVAGLDRYYQIVRCFRDEDLRADRQPEFTQLDIETSFPTQDSLFEIMEGMFAELFRQAAGVALPTPFPRMSFAEADARFGTDKPDLRWPIEMRDLSDAVKSSGFRVFRDAIAAGGEVRGFRLPGGAALSRSQIDLLAEKAKAFGAKGLLWIKEEAQKRSSSAGKALTEGEAESVGSALSVAPGDLALIVADRPNTARAALSALRLHCVEKLKIPPSAPWAFVWIVDFPLFDYDPLQKRWVSVHHPFTHPNPADLEILRAGNDLGKVRALAYDLVLNGFEIGGGSIRIHRADLQRLVFERLGLSQEEAERKFGFLMEAFQYGAPPHGGIAFGLDRIVMLLAGADAIRDVIAFPKTQSALDLTTGAPSEVDPGQLAELSLRSVRRES